MGFNSLPYFVFLPIVLIAFYAAPEKKRWIVLLASSVLFYSFLKAPHLLLALFLIISSTYFFSIQIHESRNERIKLLLFCSALAFNLGILIGIRYLGYFSEILYSSIYKSDIRPNLIESNLFLSIGVSFYAFQAISYLIDVFIEIEAPERHFGYFALYMCFFAKLLQGPIERSNELLPQLRSQKHFEKNDMYAGIFLFTWGLFKKVVIADRLSLFVDTVYDDVYSYSGLQLILATYYYSFQIYFDFSGYTDMALGTGRMFGIRLTQNFNSPYLATSIADFWRRWHISLSRWILDYIFKPLQMQFRYYRNFGTAFALMVTFLVCGAWHGLSWGFIVWGFLHGLYMGVSVYYKNIQKHIYKKIGFEKSNLKRYWQIFFTFNLVSFSWIFFKSSTLTEAFYIVNHLHFDLIQTFSNLFQDERYRSTIVFDKSRLEFLIALMGISTIAFVHKVKGIKNHSNVDDFLHATPYWFKWSTYYFLILFIIIFSYDTYGDFIYFQF